MDSKDSTTTENTCLISPYLTCPAVIKANEVAYYYFNQKEKSSYLFNKYVYHKYPFINFIELYIANLPNPKEFLNNAAWRIATDVSIETYLPGLDSQPFHKEVAYNLAGIPSAITSAFSGLKIGSSNNTYTLNHLVYAISRATIKTGIVGHALWQEPSKGILKGGLDKDSTIANYIADSVTRWIPFSTERLQSDENTDVSSWSFHIKSSLSGLARTAGSQLGSYIFSKKASPMVKGFLSDHIKKPFGLSNEPKTFSRVSEDCKKGAFMCLETITFELASNLMVNFVGACIQQPASRIIGLFAEEISEFIAPSYSGENHSSNDEL